LIYPHYRGHSLTIPCKHPPIHASKPQTSSVAIVEIP
jgi:hypothetical protein